MENILHCLFIIKTSNALFWWGSSLKWEENTLIALLCLQYFRKAKHWGVFGFFEVFLKHQFYVFVYKNVSNNNVTEYHEKSISCPITGVGKPFEEETEVARLDWYSSCFFFACVWLSHSHPVNVFSPEKTIQRHCSQMFQVIFLLYLEVVCSPAI